MAGPRDKLRRIVKWCIPGLLLTLLPPLSHPKMIQP